ncbi:MAG: hypothetical protein ACUVX8_16835, partial [Candidatus Zipacnadales bacterium]
AEAMREEAPSHTLGPLYLPEPCDAGPGGPPDLRPQVQDCAWRDVGIIRSALSLERARNASRNWLARPPCADAEDIEVGNMALVTYLMAIVALARTESRGAHFREDYPVPRDPEWRKHIVVQRGVGEGVRLRYTDVILGPAE